MTKQLMELIELIILLNSTLQHNFYFSFSFGGWETGSVVPMSYFGKLGKKT
jgi:hypothetical protein